MGIGKRGEMDREREQGWNGRGEVVRRDGEREERRDGEGERRGRNGEE